MKRAPVSRRALVQRINRALSKEGEVLKASRGERARQDLGDYYIVTLSGRAVLQKDIDIEKLARKLGTLKPFEQLID